MVSALPIPPVELSPKMEAALGAEMAHEPITVAKWQEKLLKKLNLMASVIGPQEIVSPLKSSSGASSLLLDEVCTSLRDMLDAGAIHLSQSHGATWWYWFRKRMESCASVWISTGSMHIPKMTHTHCHGYRKCWRVWWALHIFQQWTLRVDFGK